MLQHRAPNAFIEFGGVLTPHLNHTQYQHQEKLLREALCYHVGNYNIFFYNS